MHIEGKLHVPPQVKPVLIFFIFRQGIGGMGSPKRGFVISGFFSICFAITGEQNIVH